MIMFFYMFCLLLWAGLLIFLYKKYKKGNSTKKNIMLAGGLVVAMLVPTVDLFGLAWFFKEDLCKNTWTGVQVIKRIPSSANARNEYKIEDAVCPVWISSKIAQKCTTYKDAKNELIQTHKTRNHNFFVYEYLSEIWDTKTRMLLGFSKAYFERKPLLFDFEFGNMTDMTCNYTPDGAVDTLLFTSVLEQ
jgi:hypothetical protein